MAIKGSVGWILIERTEPPKPLYTPLILISRKSTRVTRPSVSATITEGANNINKKGKQDLDRDESSTKRVPGVFGTAAMQLIGWPVPASIFCPVRSSLRTGRRFGDSFGAIGMVGSNIDSATLLLLLIWLLLLVDAAEETAAAAPAAAASG